ncbi:MAG: tetratricopeptide repeat protein [Planctomycetota bacterium]|nr:MAG: tetratricopeptide repeat protein [Planctomycetota bacterium]
MNDRLTALRALLDEDPGDAFTRYALAQELRSRGSVGEALEHFAHLLREQPDYLATYYHYAALLHAEGRSAEALEVIERGVAAAEAAGDAHTRGELEDLRDEVAAG